MTRKQYEAKLAELQSELEDLKKYEAKLEPEGPPFVFKMDSRGLFRGSDVSCKFYDAAEKLYQLMARCFERTDFSRGSKISDAFMQIRHGGNYANMGFYISSPSANTKWSIVVDNDGCQVLTPTENVKWQKAQERC